MFIDRSLESLGRGPPRGRCLMAPETCDSGFTSALRSEGTEPLAVVPDDGVDSHSRGLQRATWRQGMCDCAQDPNLFRGAGGSNPDLFHPAAKRQGFFPKGPAVIQCISEIKASPRSCLMLTDTWKNWLGVDLGGSFPLSAALSLPLGLILHGLTLPFRPLSST